MGAPPAPPWDTIFFGIHKDTVLAQFGEILQLYCFFIDDVLGIFLVDTDPAVDHIKWTAFVSLMKDYYGIEWIFKEHLDNVNYMDMTIEIRGGRIVTSLYEKAMNLYLYILPYSTHYPGVLTGLVFINILFVHSLYSDKEKINRLMKEFYARFLIQISM